MSQQFLQAPDGLASITPLQERDVVASRQETIDAILKKSQRQGFVPIHTFFVQGGPQRHPIPGPLAKLVRAHDERALDLYLLLVALATKEPHSVIQPAGVLGRAIGLPGTPSGRAGVSKAISRLTRQNLVTRGRSGRTAVITLLAEDGSGEEYIRPGRRGARYFRMPLAYWDAEDAWYSRLSLPAKAMLLVSLTLSADFVLPYERAKDWYGLSAETARTGLEELRRNDLLSIRWTRTLAPLAPQGYVLNKRYTLKRPFFTGRWPRRHLPARAEVG